MQIIESLDEVMARYDALFVDLWGCLHNGREVFPEAADALRVARGAGLTVVLVTNSPRTRDRVAEQLDRFGVPRDCWDTIATSGDSARVAMYTGAVGTRVHHIGPDTDLPFFTPPEILPDPLAIERVALDEAEGLVVTGPFHDETDRPEDYRGTFLAAKQRGLKLLCANPDIIVDRGETRVICAGALAAEYTEMGGTSLYFGKPHPPIYDLARRRLIEHRGEDTPNVLCIGDGIATDIMGAMGEDLDSLFITGGLAAEETGTRHQPDPAKLEAYLAEVMMSPTYAIGKLR